MTDPAVGKEHHGVNVHVAPLPHGARLVFMTNDGKYLGLLQYESNGPESLGIMGNMFQQFVAQQTGGIQIASGSGGIRQ